MSSISTCLLTQYMFHMLYIKNKIIKYNNFINFNRYDMLYLSIFIAFSSNCIYIIYDDITKCNYRHNNKLNENKNNF